MKPVKKISIILIVFLLIVFSFFFREGLRNSFYVVSYPVQSFFWNAGRGAANFNEVLFNYQEIVEEKKDLELKNWRLLNRVNSLEELKKENEILRKALEVDLKKDFNLEMVSLFGKDFSQDIVLINKGKTDNIKEGLPLINEYGVLYGKVEKVYDNFSQVFLISNFDYSFDVKIQDKEIFAIAKGKGSLEVFLDLVPPEKNIERGDVLITSALGDHFPKGLLVGEVKEVIKEDIKPFQKSEINAFFDVKTTDNLFVLLDF